MPAETAPQERIWMAFPSGGYTLGETSSDAEAARTTWATVANAIVDVEPVVMVVAPGDEAIANRVLSTRVDRIVAPLDDAWMRDIGPTFVVNESGALGAVCWRFNGWGAQSWAHWDHDAQIGALVAEAAGAQIVESELVNEGGGIHVNGDGTVLLTETVQLDPGRNPGLTHAEVEAEMARTIGATTPLWLPRGLTRDSEQYGTRGHVDIVATFTRDGRVLYHDQTDPEHPDYEVSRHIREVLAGYRDDETLANRPIIDVVPLPAPTVLRDAEGFVDFSYVNHLVVNEAVIACVFDDPADERAIDILAAEYPGREIIPVDARVLFERGGGIHCITQQQPLAGVVPESEHAAQ